MLDIDGQEIEVGDLVQIVADNPDKTTGELARVTRFSLYVQMKLLSGRKSPAYDGIWRYNPEQLSCLFYRKPAKPVKKVEVSMLETAAAKAFREGKLPNSSI